MTEWYFNLVGEGVASSLVDKPRRRKENKTPWGKIAAVAIAALVLVAAGWYIYWSYVYSPPPEYARFDTSLGSFDVELYPACAPKTVANFVNLVNKGFYNDLVWHRIVDADEFIIQTGDPNTRGGLNSTRSTWGEGGSNQTVPLEWCGWLHNYAGYMAMARLQNDVNSGTSQFFINLSNGTANLSLDGNYTVFGKVISGMSVVVAISESKICQPPSCPSGWAANEPLPPVFVNDIVMLNGPPSTTTT
jgi:cyclophilin family peptidyl-prolyl cis-trans isomerase